MQTCMLSCFYGIGIIIGIHINATQVLLNRELNYESDSLNYNVCYNRVFINTYVS